MDIITSVNRIVRQCVSRDPFEICSQLGIIITYEPLGTIRGYYSKSRRQKFIHINNDLPDYLRNFVCAHELGHALLHSDVSTPFLRSNTLLSINRLEIEANRFAATLLLSDSDMKEYAVNEYTLSQVASCTGLPESLVDYRFQEFL